MTDFLAEHLPDLILLAVLIAWGVMIFLRTRGMSKEEKYEQIRGWLLQAVILAEQTYGSGTGRLKLSSVYSEFCKDVPWLAQVITFSTFSEYVDRALVEMKGLLSSNAAIAFLVDKED